MLTWSHRLDTIAKGGSSFEQTASADERRALRELYRVLSVDGVRALYQITPKAHGRYRVKGQFIADIQQACVVSLEPVRETLTEAFSIEFWPEDQVGEGTVEFDALDADDPEPLARDRIPVGRVLTELIALAIPPFPRAPDADLETHEAGDANETAAGADNPFAALAKLRERTGGDGTG